MPGGDGTGPAGRGPATGRGVGRKNAALGGRGRSGGFALGPGGGCVCSQCGKTVPHQRGVPCYKAKCPECGAAMTRAR